MTTNRCGTCGLNWPTGPDWRQCAQCGEPTSVIFNSQPMPTHEALSLRRHIQFEQWLENEPQDARLERRRRYAVEQEHDGA